MVEAVGPITAKESLYAWLPLAAVLFPVFGAIVVALLGRRPAVRNCMAVLSAFGAFATVAAMYRPVVGGLEIAGRLHRGITLVVSTGMVPRPGFNVDATALLLATLTSFIWLLSCIYSISYMSHEHAQTRFYSFLLLTLAANLGVLLAADFFTLFLFFEAMALSSYVLVVHAENAPSMRAGMLYLYMSVIGGLVLLGGIVLLYGLAGTVAVSPATGTALTHAVGVGFGLVIIAMMIVGFGTKAGMFFLHVWLPEAHPVAPSPASALLSGLMVKVGVYGILRTANIVLAPVGEVVARAGGHETVQAVAQGAAKAATHGAAPEAVTWLPLTSVGYVLIFAGAATMLAGMVNACFCKNCKELLAFSTISQVGYILLGLGVAAYMGRDGAMAMAGALYHIVNHALFKATLFLVIGVVLWRTGEQELSHLGGLARYMPVTAAVGFIAMLSIIGIPGTGGFAGKSLIHEAVIEAYEFSANFSPMGRPDWIIRFAEFVFTFTAAGTFAYSTRMFILVFLGKPRDYGGKIEPETGLMRGVLVTLAALIIGIGLFPNFLLAKIIGPALASFGYDPATHAYELIFNIHTGKSLIPILYDPRTLSVWGSDPVTTNVMAIGTAIFFAGTFYLVGHKVGVFDMPVSPWWSLAGWYRRLSQAVVAAVSRATVAFDRAWSTMVIWFMVTIWLPKIPSELPPMHAAEWPQVVQMANSLWNRLIEWLMVDIWLPKKQLRVRPSHWADWVAKVLKVWSVAVTWADGLFDRGVTLVLVDMWVAEPTYRAEPLPTGALAAYSSVITLADRIIDRGVTAAMVDTWVSEPGYVRQPLPPGGAPGGPEHSLARERGAAARAEAGAGAADAAGDTAALSSEADKDRATPRPLSDFLLSAWRMLLALMMIAVAVLAWLLGTGRLKW